MNDDNSDTESLNEVPLSNSLKALVYFCENLYRREDATWKDLWEAFNKNIEFKHSYKSVYEGSKPNAFKMLLALQADFMKRVLVLDLESEFFADNIEKLLDTLDE